MNADLLRKLLDSPPQVNFLAVSWKPQGRSPRFQLAELWSLNLYDFHGSVTIDGKNFSLTPGMVCLMPPGTARQFDFKTDVYHRIAHFRLAAEIIPGEFPPLLFDIGRKFSALRRDFDLAAAEFDSNQARATSILWKLLWDILADFKADTAITTPHPELRRLLIYIDNHLNQSLTVEKLVQMSVLSHNQLLRLCRQYTGESMIGYLNRRRAQMAGYLLKNTDLPIKAIAVDAGVPDMQQFNKLIHRYFGCSPRRLREERDRE